MYKFAIFYEVQDSCIEYINPIDNKNCNHNKTYACNESCAELFDTPEKAEHRANKLNYEQRAYPNWRKVSHRIEAIKI